MSVHPSEDATQKGEPLPLVLGERGDYIAQISSELADKLLDPTETITSDDLDTLRCALEEVDGLLDRVDCPE